MQKEEQKDRIKEKNEAQDLFSQESW